MRFKCAVFDLDGTLLDSLSLWEHNCSDFLREVGKVPEHGLDAKIGIMSMIEGAAYLKRNYGFTQPLTEMIQIITDRVKDAYRYSVPLKPGAMELLLALRAAGTSLVVATANERDVVEPALNRCGVLALFDAVLTCSEESCGKDSETIYRLASERANAQPFETVVFEDAVHAVKTAKAAGFFTVGVYDRCQEEFQREIKRNSDVYIKTLDEMRSYLD